MRHRPFLLPPRVALLALGVTLFAACAEQAEGERCDTLNGNADCEGSLECFAGTRLRNDVREKIGEQAGLCCPAEGVTTTVAVCQGRSGDLRDTDSGRGPAPETDAAPAPADGSPDADAALDAMPDAPALDAPALDAPALDAPALDAPALDAPGDARGDG